ncbi:1-phosphatidylinositol 4-kinase [Malassezia sp. CBS 17886]|nr:1-phosphatidylinositol 4-kinase [Malassezia sp. CBS 17886]
MRTCAYVVQVPSGTPRTFTVQCTVMDDTMLVWCGEGGASSVDDAEAGARDGNGDEATAPRTGAPRASACLARDWAVGMNMQRSHAISRVTGTVMYGTSSEAALPMVQRLSARLAIPQLFLSLDVASELAPVGSIAPEDARALQSLERGMADACAMAWQGGARGGLLDQPTHALILNDLAVNLAQEAADGTLTTQDYALIQGGVASTSAARLGSHGKLTGSTVLGILAKARFASATADAPKHSDAASAEAASWLATVLEDLEHVAAALPDTDIEEVLQAQSQWPLPDELAYTVVESLLKVATRVPDARARVLRSVDQLVEGLVRNLRVSGNDAHDLSVRGVPLLHGFARAVQDTPFAWDAHASSRAVDALSALAMDAATLARLDAALVCLAEQQKARVQCAEAFDGSPAACEPPSAFRARFLAHYVGLGAPLSGRLVAWCALSACASMLAQTLEGAARAGTAPRAPESAYAGAWAALRVGPDALPHVTDARVAAAGAQDVYETTCLGLARLSGMQPARLHAELYTRELLSTALKLAVLGAASGGADAFALVSVRGVLSEQAVMYDAMLQRAALEGVAVLARARPALAASLAETVSQFVQLPLPLWEVDQASGSPLLGTAAQALAACVRAAPDDALAEGVTYALLNRLGREDREDRVQRSVDRQSRVSRASVARPASSLRVLSPEKQGVIVASTTMVVTKLALALRRPRFTVLVLSLLVQRVPGATRSVQAALLTAIVPLALAVSMPHFIDVVTLFSDVARTAMDRMDAARVGAVHAAQLLLARGLTPAVEAAGRVLDAEAAAAAHAAPSTVGASSVPPRKQRLLMELLQLVIDSGRRCGVESVAVQSLPPVLAALLGHEDLNPHWGASDEEVYLFRNAWVVLAFGARPLVSPMPRDALSVVAAKTPTLLAPCGRNYVDNDIDTNSVLREDALGVTPERVRRALAPLLGPRVLDGRVAHLARLAFLHAVLHVEWRRSAVGHPSMMLWYFAQSGVADSSLYAPLRAVSERAFGVYLVHTARIAEEHRMDSGTTSEVRNILVASCHRVAAVREGAAAYWERLLSAFPELFGHPDVVVTMLELLSLLAQACDGEVDDAYLPQYTFASAPAGVAVELLDTYAQRKQLLVHVYGRVRTTLTRVQSEMPQELSCVLLRYLRYVDAGAPLGSDGLGKSVAMDFARGLPPQDPVTVSPVRHDASGLLVRELSAAAQATGAQAAAGTAADVDALKRELAGHLAAVVGGHPPPLRTLQHVLYRGAATLLVRQPLDFELVHDVVALPFAVCTKSALAVATGVWSWILAERPDTETALVGAVVSGWTRTIAARQGIYSTELVAVSALLQKTDMSASDRGAITRTERRADELFSGHTQVLQLLGDRLQASRSSNPALVTLLALLVQRQTDAAPLLSDHALTRSMRFALVEFGLRVLAYSHLDTLIECRLRDGVLRLALDWFASPPSWSFGGNMKRATGELQHLRHVQQALRTGTLRAATLVTAATVAQDGVPRLSSAQPLVRGCTVAQALQHVQAALDLLQVLLQSEEARLLVWQHPTDDAVGAAPVPASPAQLHTAWRMDARVAAQLVVRCGNAALREELGTLVRGAPHRALASAGAVEYLLEGQVQLGEKAGTNLKWLQVWDAVPPVDAIALLSADLGRHPLVLQYGMRALEAHPEQLVFFYVPQVVQALRDDTFGYVEQFILKQSLIAQLFCHQIIWNMKANTYKDDNAEVPDSLKPTLDRMIARIVGALSGPAEAFYEREFAFFNEVTSISGKLKPYIKKSKADKKAKIDEEMALIVVDPGVYLPSNPDGVLVDLDRRSGRPLQSHAKAPFMATFLVRRPVAHADEGAPVYVDVWQSAIFKVGDDCRQDVLALQVIAQFKNIFQDIGLDVYLNPYRVTATAPGCGVIDVVPNATSRDEMGRQKINDLLHFFHDRWGPDDSVSFQRARLNFIQSMAAYSVTCHILQIRDRHNGNMMIDGDGHLIHIDFGFLFDIGPGGMRFEPYSFKLSHEMVAVMGGPESPGFRMFEQLTVKAFLAVRPFVNEIVATCGLMLGTDLPSFKGPSTLVRLRERFKPNLSEREAAKHARWLVKDAYGNARGVLYDLLQEKQNHIPYRR